MSDTTPPEHGLSIHRIEALTDGIYAVAMTLLVIELKLPEHAGSSADLGQMLLDLVPRVWAWFLSFFVLAFFWWGHYRTHSHLRHADGRLVALNLWQLALVSLMPFSCALIGGYSGLVAQVAYSVNMALLAVSALLIVTHVYRHPEQTHAPISRGFYRGACIRNGGLILISGLTVVIQALMGEGTRGGLPDIAFALMAVIGPLSRRAERASGPAGPRPAPHPGSSATR